MSTSKKKKKVVTTNKSGAQAKKTVSTAKKTVTTAKKTVSTSKKTGAARKERIRPTSARGRSGQKMVQRQPLLFDWTNYRWMLIGIGFIALGMLLMLGGSMPSPDVWDPDIIYSFRRTVLSPLVILIGLGIEVYAIFKQSPTEA